MMEESTMKKSRTSSISSVSCGLTPSGTLGSVRNSIRSSLSSSQGFAQVLFIIWMDSTPLIGYSSCWDRQPGVQLTELTYTKQYCQKTRGWQVT